MRETQQALDAIRHLVRALRLSEREAEKVHSLTSAQMFVLQRVAENPGLSLGELATLTATDQSSVSVVVRRLVDGGYLRRDRAGEDARRLVIRLTPAGTRLLKRSRPTAQQRLIESIEKLTPRQRKELASLLQFVVSAMGLHGVPPMIGEERPAPRSRARRR